MSPRAVAPSMTTPSHCGTPGQGTKTCACGWEEKCGHRGRAHESGRNNQSAWRVSGNTTITKLGSETCRHTKPVVRNTMCARRTSSRRRQDKSKQCKAARDRRKPEQEADTSQETDLAGAHGAERFAGGREERHSHGLRLRHHRLQPLYLLVRHQRAGKQKPAESGPGGREGGRDERRAQDKWVEIRRGRASARGGRSNKMPAALSLHAQASLRFPKPFQKECDKQARQETGKQERGQRERKKRGTSRRSASLTWSQSARPPSPYSPKACTCSHASPGYAPRPGGRCARCKIRGWREWDIEC